MIYFKFYRLITTKAKKNFFFKQRQLKQFNLKFFIYIEQEAC